MKKSIYTIVGLVFITALLLILSSNYSFYLNEPFHIEEILKTNDTVYVQEKYYSDADYSVLSVKINNTILNTVLGTIFKGNSIKNPKYASNYILKVNNKTKIIEKKLYWNEEKYGFIKVATLNSRGDIFVLSNKQSIDLSRILEENIVSYADGNNIGELIYSKRYSEFVNDVNRSIHTIDILSDSLVWTEYDGELLDIKEYSDFKISNKANIRLEADNSKRLNNIVLMDNYCYLTLSNNRLYKLSYNNSELTLLKSFSNEKKSVYKLYKFDNDKIFIHLHKSFGEELQTYDGYSYENLNLNNTQVNTYLKNQFVSQLSNYKYHFDYLKYLIIAIYIVILILTILLIRYIYVYVLNKKIYITFKLVLCILPILLIGNYFIATFSTINNYELVEEELFLGKLQSFNEYYKSKNTQMALKYGSDVYLGDLLSKIKPYKDIDEKTLDQIYEIMDYSFVDKTYDTSGWYWSVDVIDNNCMYKIIDSELNDTVFFSRFHLGSNEDAKRIINGKIYTSMDFDDKYIFCLYPVTDSSGKVVGAVQIGTYYYGFKNQLFNRFFTESSNKISVMTNISLIVLVLVTFKSLFPLIKLAKKIEGTNSERIEEIKEIHSNDEIQILTHAFNNMARNINENMKNIIELNNSYYRFVPLELINLLGKKDIKDMNLGDNVDKNIAILCVGINDFYNVMINNQTGKIFNAMSNIYEYIGPIIRKHGGVIDRFIDKGLIAMFPKSVDGCVEAAIEIVKSVRESNLDNNKFDGINLSCAINVGEVTFGIIGEEKRLQNSAISYTTSYATIMQEYSRRLSSNIVISKEAYERLSENSKILCRYLGKVKFSIVGEIIDLYDIYEADSSNIKKLKNINKKEFNNAIVSFEQCDYLKARQGFVAVLDKNIEDEIARIYFYQSDLKINSENLDKENAILEI